MNPKQEAAATAAAWWRALQPDAGAGRAGDRAALARLRRSDLLGAMDDEATFALFHALGRTRAEDLPAVALCAAVLAAVRRDDPGVHPGRALGPPPGGPPEGAPMKPLRFRRLIEAETEEERLTLLRRAVQLADCELSVQGVAEACLDWSDRCRRRWIFEYHNAGRAAPGADAATGTVDEETIA
jgi:CRISPR system Cascade subunit CasB